MSYRFKGWEANILPVNNEYKGIKCPKDLYEALTKCWCAQTSPPRMREKWSPANMTLGQCSITAFLAQDIFGGEVYGIPLPGGFFHCFNVVDGVLFDLTNEQFGDETLDYNNCYIQSRRAHFDNPEKKERYEILKSRLKEITGC